MCVRISLHITLFLRHLEAILESLPWTEGIFIPMRAFLLLYGERASVDVVDELLDVAEEAAPVAVSSIVDNNRSRSR